MKKGLRSRTFEWKERGFRGRSWEGDWEVSGVLCGFIAAGWGGASQESFGDGSKVDGCNNNRRGGIWHCLNFSKGSEEVGGATEF